MAQLRMLKGVSTALPAVSANTEGTIFYTYDDSLFHLDYKNENGELVRKTLNAEQANSLLNARTITLTGDVSGSVSFDGSQNVDIQTTISNDFAIKEDLNALETVLTDKIEQIESQFKLVTYENMITVASARQITFDTGFETFDPKEDTLQVHHGRLYLTAGEDYVLSGRQVVLNEAPEVGDTLTFTLFKNVPILEDEITFSPSLLEDGSIPLSKLEEMPAVNVNIKTYNNLEQIGLSNDDMSSTDFLANIKAINTALGEDDSILYLTTTNADNLHLSVVDKLSSDMGREIGYVDYTKCCKFVAIPYNSNVAAYSEDGINWIETELPYNTYWQSVTYGNGKFVAIAGDGSVALAAYSEDGINWVGTELPPVHSWSSVTYGNGKFVAISWYFSSKAAYSEDGINWVGIELPISNPWSSVTYGNGKFVAVASGHYGDQAIYSEDGITWTTTTLPTTDSGWLSVTYGNGKFVTISYNSNVAAYSEDGINWVGTELPISDFWSSVAYGNGKFVATTNRNNVAIYSEDGINWTEITLPAADSGYGWDPVIFGNGKFIAISNSTSTYSEDGINWTTTTLLGAGWQSITYGSQFSKQYTSVPLSLKISRTGNAYNAITIDLIYNSGVEATYIYSCVYNKETDTADDTLSKFVITTHPKGFVSKEEVSSDAAMKLLYELGIIDPIINSDGEILTDENGNIFVF